MILKEEIEKYLCYCHLQKGLDEKTIKAYSIDLGQFLDFIEELDQKLNVNCNTKLNTDKN